MTSEELTRMAFVMTTRSPMWSEDWDNLAKFLTSLASVAEDEPAKYEASELVISGTGPQLKTVTSNEFGSIREEYADYWRNKAMQLAVENEQLKKDLDTLHMQIQSSP